MPCATRIQDMRSLLANRCRDSDGSDSFDFIARAARHVFAARVSPAMRSKRLRARHHIYMRLTAA